ncbi:MAG: tetratricopeptide repeat protein, partial [Planctomycetota bacterium]
MPRRYFNWKLAVVLLMGLVVLGVTAFGLRKWRRSNRAERGFEAGLKAYDEHNWQEAAHNLGSYLAIERDDVPILLKYADAHLHIRPLKQNNLRQAIAAYRAALRVDKSNAEAATKLTEMYIGMRMPGEAELIAARYLETNQDLKLRRMLAVALARQRKFDEAATELKNIIEDHPDQVLVYEIYGQLAEQYPDNFPDPPESCFNQAVKNNPSSALAYVIRAAFHLRSKDRTKAMADLNQAEKLDLSEPLVRLRLAGEFINAKVLDKAEKHLEEVQILDPTNQALWQIWAQYALKSQAKEKMFMVAETALKELSAQPWDFMPTAAELFIRSGRLEEAADCISKLRQKEIAKETTVFLEGLLIERQGRTYEAVESFRRAMQMGNKSPQVRLLLASTISQTGDTQSALRYLRALVSESPDFFDGRLALAKLLARSRNWPEAAEQAQQALKISPDSLDAVLLSIQARIQLLAEQQIETNSQMWLDIEDRLAALDKTVENVFSIKMLQFQLAFEQSQFSKAQQLLSDMKKSNPSRLEVAIAGVQLLIAQDKNDEAITKLYDVVNAFPQSISPVRYLAVLLEEKGSNQEYENVIKDALKRLEKLADKRQLGLLLSEFYRDLEEQDKRYQLLESLSRDIPDDVLVLRELLRCQKVIKDSNLSQQLVDKIKSIEGEQGWQWRYEQVRVWFAQDDFQDSYPKIIVLLKENLLANPDDQTSRMMLAAACEKAGQLQLAISTYREALNRSPQDLRVIVPAVAALYKANEFERADEILQTAAGQKLFNPDLRKLEAQSYLRRGELGSASDILEGLLTDDPNNRAICLSLALLKMRQEKFEEAGQLLDRLKIQEPNSLPVAVAHVEWNIRQGKSDQALLLCDEVVNNLNNAPAYVLRAKTLASLGEPNKAIEDFHYAITSEPNNAGAWVARSDFHRSINRMDQAVDDIQQALFVDPDNLTIQKRAVSIFLSSSDPNRAFQGKNILDKALTENPDDIQLRLYKARSLLAEETIPAIKNAERILREITEEQPKASEVWVLLGEVFRRQNLLKEAMDTALQGLVHRPNNRELLLLKARVEQQRSPLLAIPTLRLLHEMDPNDVDIVVFLANTYVEAKESEKAVILLKTKINSYSSLTDKRKVNIALARALYKSGSKADAQKVLGSLIQSVPDDPGPL